MNIQSAKKEEEIFSPSGQIGQGYTGRAAQSVTHEREYESAVRARRSPTPHTLSHAAAGPLVRRGVCAAAVSPRASVA